MLECTNTNIHIALNNNCMTVGTEVLFLDNLYNKRYGVIEYIDQDNVHIKTLDDLLHITTLGFIMYTSI
jgi:hypothetical protein